MSELKEWTASELAEDGKIDCTRVYIKEDVNKVIAELKADYKEVYNRLQTANMKLSLGLGAKKDVDY